MEKDLETVECKICGKRYTTLANHLFRAHLVTSAQYLQMYPDAPLVSEEFKRKQSISHLKKDPLQSSPQPSDSRTAPKSLSSKEVNIDETFSQDRNVFSNLSKTNIDMPEVEIREEDVQSKIDAFYFTGENMETQIRYEKHKLKIQSDPGKTQLCNILKQNIYPDLEQDYRILKLSSSRTVVYDIWFDFVSRMYRVAIMVCFAPWSNRYRNPISSLDINELAKDAWRVHQIEYEDDLYKFISQALRNKTF
jgi:hypothetical protein